MRDSNGRFIKGYKATDEWKSVLSKTHIVLKKKVCKGCEVTYQPIASRQKYCNNTCHYKVTWNREKEQDNNWGGKF